MAYKPRGPREWSPRMKPGVVEGFMAGDEYYLKFLRHIKTELDLPDDPDFRVNAELGIKRKDPMELYEILNRYHGKDRGAVGHLLWFPTFRRAGVSSWTQDGEFLRTKWTDATNEVDALARWVGAEMIDEG